MTQTSDLVAGRVLDALVAERAKYVSLTRIVSTRGSAHDGEWSCILRFSRYNDDADSGDAHEKTAPLAICRAALKAAGA